MNQRRTLAGKEDAGNDWRPRAATTLAAERRFRARSDGKTPGVNRLRRAADSSCRAASASSLHVARARQWFGV